jgi:hypothetical protein
LANLGSAITYEQFYLSIINDSDWFFFEKTKSEKHCMEPLNIRQNTVYLKLYKQKSATL